MELNKFPVIRNNKEYLVQVIHRDNYPIWWVDILQKNRFKNVTLHESSFWRSTICDIEDDDDFIIKLTDKAFKEYEKELKAIDQRDKQADIFLKWSGKF